MRSTNFFSPQVVNSQVNIRKAALEDVGKIALILKRTFQKTYIDPITKGMIFPESDLDEMCANVLDEYPRLLDKENTYLLVAELNNNVVGFSKMDVKKNDAYLEKLYILPEYQDMKIGIKLLKNCMEYALSININCIRLQVWDQNEKAIKFYKNNLFVVTGTHEKVTSDGNHSSGYDLQCNDIPTALDKLNSYNVVS